MDTPTRRTNTGEFNPKVAAATFKSSTLSDAAVFRNPVLYPLTEGGTMIIDRRKCSGLNSWGVS
jgi:hypothetical protein